MKFKTVMSIALSLLLMTSMALGIAAAQGDETKPVKCPKKVGVLVEEVVTGTFMEYKDLEKKILPGRSDDFNSTVTGTVKTVAVAVGSEVKTGDVVIQLDGDALNEAIATSSAQIKKWKRILFKRKNWKVRSENAEKNAERIIKSNEKTVASSQEQLKQLDLTSPVDGIITHLAVATGDQINPGSRLGTIINIETVKIPLTTYAGKVKEGQAVKFSVKEISKTVAGKVIKGADNVTYIAAANPGKQIRSGMNAQFKILFKKHTDVVVLPEMKVMKEDGSAFVYVTNGKRARKAALKTGPEGKGMVVVREGLSAGDELIVAEVLSAKQGTLRDELTCLEDNKKIAILIKNEAKGRYSKRKKGAAKKPVSMMAEKPVKKTEAPPKKEKTVVVKKETKTEPKKKQAEGLDAVDVFVDYLTNNKDSLKYKRFKKMSNRDAAVVVVYCDEAAKDRLVSIMDKFKARKYDVLTPSEGSYEVEATFDAPKRTVRVEKGKPGKVRRPRRERTAPAGRFRIGVHGSFSQMSDTAFKDVYGNFVVPGIDLAVFVTDKIDVWASVSTGSKTAEIPGFTDFTLKFKLTPAALDVRYYFKRDATWDFFAGAGISYFAFEEENPIENVKDNAMGFNMLGGVYYNVANNISVQLAFRYNFVKKTITEPEVDNDLDLSGPELLFGISFRF
ncbi:MAG: biotin/lipoyl-binding protein [bacterium]|nr:biotin/lipoyl-binding protein [bacterium]